MNKKNKEKEELIWTIREAENQHGPVPRSLHPCGAMGAGAQSVEWAVANWNGRAEK